MVLSDEYGIGLGIVIINGATFGTDRQMFLGVHGQFSGTLPRLLHETQNIVIKPAWKFLMEFATIA